MTIRTNLKAGTNVDPYRSFNFQVKFDSAS